MVETRCQDLRTTHPLETGRGDTGDLGVRRVRERKKRWNRDVPVGEVRDPERT